MTGVPSRRRAIEALVTGVAIAALVQLAVPIGWKLVLKPYQKERILTVFDPSRRLRTRI